MLGLRCISVGKSRTHAVLSLAILLACCARSFALDPSLDISQYAHTSWKIRDGFAKGMTLSIAQTPDGYLWLGTEFGLLRFDGVRAVPWQPPGGERLPSDFIRGLLGARDGTLWIGTQAGVAGFKDGKLTMYPESMGRNAGPFLQDQQGTVWVGLFDPGEICALRSGKAQCYGAGSFGQGVFALYEDRRNNLWVSAATGLWRWAPGPRRRYSFPAGVTYSDLLTEDDNGVLLLGTEQGLKQLVGGKIQSYSIPRLPPHIRPHFFRSTDGSLWILTGQGLLRLHNGRIDKFSASDGLSGDHVNAIFEDREGSVWVSTTEGIDRFRELAVPRVSTAQGLLNSLVYSVQAAADGSIWMGTWAGLNRLKGGRVTGYRSQGRLASNSDTSERQQTGESTTELANSGLKGEIVALGLDDAGHLWASSRGGLFYFSGEGFVRVAGVPGQYSDAISADGHGNIWILNGHDGLFQVRANGAVQKIVSLQPISAHQTYWGALLPDRPGHGLWIGSYDGGIVYFKDGQVRASYTANDGLGAGMVYHLRFGSRGALWAATQGGLSRFKDGYIATLTSKNGLPCDEVHWSMEDDDHAVWLYMPCGLVRIERSELDAWVSGSRHVVKTTVFDSSDGVRSRAYPIGTAPPVTESTDGKIWFTTWDGVSVIDPRHLAFNKLPPPVHIEKIVADDKIYEVANGMRLPAQVRNLTIDYTALSLVVPEKVRFRIKLEGQDKDWRELTDRHVQYTNLPPKRYRFRVLACNNSGVWNEEGAALDFVIPPAWYQTNWFRAACVAAFLAILWGIYELRVRQLAHQFNMRLEERVAERTRVARDLHDTLLQSFQALLPSLQAGINMLAARPADARKVLEDTADHASQAIAEGRDAVQGLRMSTVEKNDLAVAIRTVGEELASAASTQPSPNFNVVVEGASRNLHPILRDEVYRLATEALRNAFRHAAAQNIEVEIRYDEKYFRLRVRDDGKGIPSDVLGGDGREGHYGLPGMRERAKLVGGKLAIWTELDGGTEIELNIPGARAYVKSTRTFWHFGKRSATDTDEKEPIERE